jgi:hypothetical protein
MLRPVLVTTAHRGVFFGYLDGMPDSLPEFVDLTNARNCIYWSRDVKGFLGLAVSGPTSSCRIGPKVESLRLYDITSVAAVTDDAQERWEDSPWS